MKDYINDKKKLYATILDFIENSEDSSNEIDFQSLSTNIKIQEISGNCEEMEQFLQIINNISDQHSRKGNFIKIIEHTLQYYKEQIMQTLSDIEIYRIFGNNKIILLYLLKNGFIKISDTIYNEMICKLEQNGNRYCYFFYPELEKFVDEERMKDVKNELLAIDPNIFDKYEEKRQEGENDSYICFLIRNDSIVEFISFVSCNNISITCQITPSIFETNSFLIDSPKTTLIEYSAFYGSIQIFQYLMMNNAELTPSLWLYMIHSNNSELLYLIESKNIPPPNSLDEDENYIQCFIESIKCHHNCIADYIQNNLIDQKNFSEQTEKILSNCIKYHNYEYFQNDLIYDHGFFYLSFYHYDKLFNLYLEEKDYEIKSEMILNLKNFNDKMISIEKF